MRKRILIAITAVATMSLIGATIATGADDFIDVGNDNIFHDDIGWMSDNGITYGYGDGTFGPADNVTRGQMSAFIHRLHDAIQDDIPSADDLVVEVINEIDEGDITVITEKGEKGEKGDTGPQGPEGPKGDTGDTGPQGEPGLANLSTDGPYPGEGAELQDESLFLDDGRAEFGEQWESGQVNLSAVRCADTKAAVGGGFKVGSGGPASGNPDVNVTASYPAYIDASGDIISETDAASIALGDTSGSDQDWSFEPNGWVVEGYYDGGGVITVRPFVTCATVGS